MIRSFYRMLAIVVMSCCLGISGWVTLTAQQPGNPFGQTFFNIEDKYIEGCTAMMKEDYDEAVKIFESILEQRSTHHASRYNLAKIALIRSQYDTVIDQIRLALKEDDSNYWYYLLLRKAYDGKGDIARALEVQENIVANFPEKKEEQYQLIELHITYGQTEEALNVLKKMESQYGLDEQLLFRKYKIYDQMGAKKEQLATLEELHTLSPNNMLYYRSLYDAYLEDNNEKAAMSILEEMLQIDPDDGYALLTMFDYRRRKGDIEAASTLLMDVFGNDQVKLDWKVNLLKELISSPETRSQGQWQLSQLANQLRQAYPGNPQTISVLGDVFRIEEEWDSALVYYRKALDSDPAAIDIWALVLQTTRDQGNFEQMYYDAEEAIAFFPNNSKLLLYYAIASARLEKWSQATYALDKMEKNPSLDVNLQSALKRERGWMALYRGNLSEALKWVQEAIELNEDALAVELLGDILFRQGNRDQAIKQWERAQKLGRENIDIPSKLAQ